MYILYRSTYLVLNDSRLYYAKKSCADHQQYRAQNRKLQLQVLFTRGIRFVDMNESKKRALNLTPSSAVHSNPDKKRMLSGSPQRPMGLEQSSARSIDWQREFLVQKCELNRIKMLNDYLELERKCEKGD